MNVVPIFTFIIIIIKFSRGIVFTEGQNSSNWPNHNRNKGCLQDFTVDFYFRQYWHDPRLNFSGSSDEDELCISNEMLGRIWWPDTFFANAKMASFHTATTHNAFLRISPNGNISQSLRYFYRLTSL